MSRPPTEKDSLLPTSRERRTRAVKLIHEQEQEDDEDKDDKVNDRILRHLFIVSTSTISYHVLVMSTTHSCLTSP